MEVNVLPGLGPDLPNANVGKDTGLLFLLLLMEFLTHKHWGFYLDLDLSSPMPMKGRMLAFCFFCSSGSLVDDWDYYYSTFSKAFPRPFKKTILK